MFRHATLLFCHALSHCKHEVLVDQKAGIFNNPDSSTCKICYRTLQDHIISCSIPFDSDFLSWRPRSFEASGSLQLSVSFA